MKKHLPFVREHSLLHSPFVIGVMLVLVVAISTEALSLLTKERAFAEQMRARVTVHDHLEEVHQELLGNVAFIESERGQEEAIRRQFDVVRAGESLVVIPEVHEKKTAIPTIQPDTTPPPTIWERLIFWK